MPDLVRQIGELFLRAVPVALIVVVFYLVLRSLFFQPLLKVMAERDARTLGAQKSGANPFVEKLDPALDAIVPPKKK